MGHKTSNYVAEINYRMKEIGWTVKRIQKKKDEPILTIVLDGNRNGLNKSFEEQLKKMGYGFCSIKYNVGEDDEIHLDARIFRTAR